MVITDIPLADVVKPKDLAEYIGTTEAALAQDRYLGRGLPYLKTGCRVRYSKVDVIAYLNAARRSA